MRGYCSAVGEVDRLLVTGGEQASEARGDPLGPWEQSKGPF